MIIERVIKQRDPNKGKSPPPGDRKEPIG